MLANFFLNWILKDCIKVKKKKKESCLLVFPSSTKCQLRPFHVVVVHRRQRNVQESVMHVQSCCFACLNLLLFWRSCCRRRRPRVNSLVSCALVWFWNHMHVCFETKLDSTQFIYHYLYLNFSNDSYLQWHDSDSRLTEALSTRIQIFLKTEIFFSVFKEIRIHT